MSSVYSNQRPGFWRVPKFKSKDPMPQKKKVHFYDDPVQPNSPANPELMRGDIITKVEDYDARDLRHEDAQLLFRTQDNKIRLVVRRDNKIAMNSSKTNPISSLPPANVQASYIPSHDYHQHVPYRAPSPNPRGPLSSNPIESLPHTTFSNDYQQQYTPYQQAKQDQHVNYPPPPPPRSCFSPQLTRDLYQSTQSNDDENAAIQNQPYRSTPLILPGAKNNLHKNITTESYLRHHPNPQMRGAPIHDFTDIQMKQKVADTVLHRVVGPQAQNGPQVVHKQFNSPIGLYSDNLISDTIKTTVSPPQSSMMSPGSTQSAPSPSGSSYRPTQNPQQFNRPTKIQGYKKTVVYDPLKSETYRALQEDSYGALPTQEVAAPAQPRVFQPNKIVPGKKPVYHTQESFPPPDPLVCSAKHHPINSIGDNDVIHQSNSFKRLMWHVLGETEY